MKAFNVIKKVPFIFVLWLILAVASCSRVEEMDLEEIEAFAMDGLDELLAKTTTKPWQGEEFVPGVLGGTWHSSMSGDPKTFNHLLAERDGESNGIMARMLDNLWDYDVVRREWKPQIASFEIKTDEEKGTLDLFGTLRDDLFWTYYNSDEKIPVTSDDLVFWYDEIEGDPAFQSSSYNQQFIVMEDGSVARCTIEKIDDRRFVFHFPRIIAEPLLSTNRNFGPRHIFEPAKRAGGQKAVQDLFSVASDPRRIPSMGQWYLVEYVPSLRLVFKRNPHYWRKDANGLSIPYFEENVVRILPDQNTQFLVFKQGGLEDYSARPEDLNELIQKKNAPYTVFNAEASLSAPFWSFNQNPQNKSDPHFYWFTKKEFRQAMSCLVNRSRISAQVFRGLAEPKLGFFPPPNPFYNPDIRVDFLYDPERAVRLLASIGFVRDGQGIMRDDKGRRIEFGLSVPADASVATDTASIIADELSKVGIKLNIQATDFQKQVEQLTRTYDWESIMMRFGPALFPTQGSNVWPSDGNLHLWYPLQETPATEWEARIDHLYNEGSFTIDKEKAWAIWNEYQSIILEQLPVIYLMGTRSFWALNNRWDFSNVFFDNLNGAETNFAFLDKH
jgi:peptide/nickel transport system substrate-binding protein